MRINCIVLFCAAAFFAPSTFAREFAESGDGVLIHNGVVGIERQKTFIVFSGSVGGSGYLLGLYDARLAEPEFSDILGSVPTDNNCVPVSSKGEPVVGPRGHYYFRGEKNSFGRYAEETLTTQMRYFRTTALPIEENVFDEMQSLIRNSFSLQCVDTLPMSENIEFIEFSAKMRQLFSIIPINPNVQTLGGPAPGVTNYGYEPVGVDILASAMESVVGFTLPSKLRPLKSLAQLNRGVDGIMEVNINQPIPVNQISDAGNGKSPRLRGGPFWHNDLFAWCYEGSVIDGKAEGTGTLFLDHDCTGKDTLTGEFKSGLLTGKVLGRSELTTTVGEFVSGRKHGQWEVYSNATGSVLTSEPFADGRLTAGTVIYGRQSTFEGVLFDYAQFVGARSKAGDVEGTTIPVVSRFTTPGQSLYFNGESLTYSDKRGTVQYSMFLDASLHHFYPSGSCVFQYGGNTRSGNCHGAWLISGPCRTTSSDGEILDATCENGKVVGGLGHLSGNVEIEQWVNIAGDGSYEYNVPDWWDRVRDTISEKPYLLVVPYANPDAWTDLAQKLIGDFNREIEKNTEIAKTFEFVCGPRTGGCNYPLDDHETKNPIHLVGRSGSDTRYQAVSASAYDPDMVLTSQFGRSPASFVANNANAIVDQFVLAAQVFLIHRLETEINLVRKEMKQSLKPGQTATKRCQYRDARIVSCWDIDQAAITAPNPKYFDVAAFGKLPESEWRINLREESIMDHIKGNSNNRVLISPLH
jgi:hypothetical protein